MTAEKARAEDPTELETADGWQGCYNFREKNQRELESWEAAQPPVPYRYPREKTFLNAPWPQFFSNLGRAGDLVLATLIPHVGAQYRAEAPAAYIGWPWSIFVFGPMYSCSRKNNTFVVH